MRKPDERAAGGIVARGGKVLLVQVENLKGEVVWTFPKGHLEKGETPLRAALREVEEETGWSCRSLGPLDTATYWFTREGRRVFKRVDWYRFEPVEKTGEPDATEILKTLWTEAGKAREMLAYPGDLKLLAKWTKKDNTVSS